MWVCGWHSLLESIPRKLLGSEQTQKASGMNRRCPYVSTWLVAQVLCKLDSVVQQDRKRIHFFLPVWMDNVLLSRQTGGLIQSYAIWIDAPFVA